MSADLKQSAFAAAAMALVWFGASALAFAPERAPEAERSADHTIERGFEPLSSRAVAFGQQDASELDPACVGEVPREPSMVLDVTEPVPLLISAAPEQRGIRPHNTVLVVRGPDGAYICDDDSAGDLDPQILIPRPAPGRYEIWFGINEPFHLGVLPLSVDGQISVVEARTAGPGPAEAETPPFPRWPPPRASARAQLPLTIFAGDASLGAVADRLMGALRDAGNARASFYTAPGGFVLVARLERIRNDARPQQGAGRFIEPRPGDENKPDDPLGFVEALFFAPEGRYRQVMFVVSDQVVGQGAWTLSSDAATTLLNEGSSLLARDYRVIPMSSGHRVTALIYEFRKQGNVEATVALPGRWNANTHLTRSGLMSSLRR
ncbi:MAG: hypothetical protein AB7P07_06280 [Hyphomonadaceae bacterium]